MALLAASLPAGCFERTEPTPPADPVVWGLGLDIPEELPPPGPFLEPVAEMQHLFAFANESIRPMFDRCEEPDRPERFVSNLASKWDLYAFTHLRDVCQQWNDDWAKAKAQSAIANGTEAEEFQVFLDEMNGTIDSLVAALHAMPAPRTQTDAEFQGELARKVHERILFRRGLVSSFASYEATKDSDYAPYHLTSVFYTFAQTRSFSQAYLHFIQQYDWEWQEGACLLPSVEDAHAEIQASYDKALALAQRLADPDDANSISNPYGNLVKVRRPSIDFYAKEGFVPALLHLQHDLDFSVAYWENLTTDARPTLEEAQWLLADHHAKGRALAMEDIWTNEDAIVAQADFWEDDPDRAVRPIALQAVHWRFADLQC